MRESSVPTPTLSAPERRTVEQALGMYREGWFPMLREHGRGVEWVQPEERGVIPLDGRFTVPRSLAQRVRSGRFFVTTDRAFGDVIRACAAPAKGREETWIDPSIIDLFDLLHRAGHAHSVEAWLPPTRDAALRGTHEVALCTAAPPEGSVLVGGLYGLSLGSVFCGESMFSRPDLGGRDASKVCLVHLVEHLRGRGFSLLDAQLHNEHLEQFGLIDMPRAAYLRHVAASCRDDRGWATGREPPGA